MVRRVLEEVGADPQAIRAQLEEEAQKGGRTDVSPSLAPDAKRALPPTRSLGIWAPPTSVPSTSASAGRRRRIGWWTPLDSGSHTKLRGAVVRGVDTGGEAREPASATLTLDEYSRDLPRWPVRASSIL